MKIQRYSITIVSMFSRGEMLLVGFSGLWFWLGMSAPLPLVEGERHLPIPPAVLLEWQEVIHQGKKLGA